MFTWPSSASTVSTGSIPVGLALSASISSAMLVSGVSDIGSSGSSRRNEAAGLLVEQMQHPVGNGEERAAQRQLVAPLLLAHARKGAQVGEADLDRGLLHRPLGRPALGAELARDRLAHLVEHLDPVGDEAALAGLGAAQLLGQRGLAAAAHAVAHDHDLAHLEHSEE